MIRLASRDPDDKGALSHLSQSSLITLQPSFDPTENRQLCLFVCSDCLFFSRPSDSFQARTLDCCLHGPVPAPFSKLNPYPARSFRSFPAICRRQKYPCHHNCEKRDGSHPGNAASCCAKHPMQGDGSSHVSAFSLRLLSTSCIRMTYTPCSASSGLPLEQ